MTTEVLLPEPKLQNNPRKRRGVRRKSSLLAQGEPMIWLTGGSLALCVVMIAGLLGLVLYQGGRTFWVNPIQRVVLEDGSARLGEVVGTELTEEGVRNNLFRTENFDLTLTHHEWVADDVVTEETAPEWALLVERYEWGHFYGYPERMLVDGEVVADTPAEVYAAFTEHHPGVVQRRADREHIETVEMGEVQARLEAGRIELRSVELEYGDGSPEMAAAEEAFAASQEKTELEYAELRAEIEALSKENEIFELVVKTEQGQEKAIPMDNVVRVVRANQLGLTGVLAVYVDRWWQFLTDIPRQSNTAGGVWPAIQGTIVMTMLMSILVVPFGVLAALYLREYARQGYLVSVVRIAVGNLAGVPSIVFGVFGLGFFCYIVGGSIDSVFFRERLPNPTYGAGGLIWACLTLALLTLPVVIVATEEALAAVPNSMREGSYACGATKWQTIRRIVLPRAAPGIITGMILAIARGAGEVAPLMLVGVAAVAPEPLSLLHPERKFMHLGYHIYEVGFKSQNSEAARPLVFTTTLLLIGIVVLLNIIAIQIRSRLRRRYAAAR